jgi:hypothetical protein
MRSIPTNSFMPVDTPGLRYFSAVAFFNTVTTLLAESTIREPGK